MFFTLDQKVYPLTINMARVTMLNQVAESPFLFLTSELPPPPLFKDEYDENIIPQVPFLSC